MASRKLVLASLALLAPLPCAAVAQEGAPTVSQEAEPTIAQEAEPAAPAQAPAFTRIWDCASDGVSYEIRTAPGATEAEIAVRVGDNVNTPPIRTYAVGIVAPFPRFDFSDGDNRFYATGEGARFISAGEDPIACAERTLVPPDPGPDGRLDLAGASLGGRLRSGPGTQYAPLGTLEPGTPLTIVAGTEVVLDDFLWWEVEVEGTRLFHWGGVLCALDAEPVGLAACGGPAPELPEGAVLRSQGGNVRAGPGTGFDEIGTIAPGTELTILSETGIVLDGAPWFEIAFEEGTAYHWGGLICIAGEAGNTGFAPC